MAGIFDRISAIWSSASCLTSLLARLLSCHRSSSRWMGSIEKPRPRTQRQDKPAPTDPRSLPAAEPRRPVGDLGILDPAEQQRQVVTEGRSALAYPAFASAASASRSNP